MAIGEASFTQACVCGRGFSDLGAFTRHQKACGKGKKRLASVLAKAKEVYQGKRARLAPPNMRFGLDNAETGLSRSSSESRGSEPLAPGPFSLHSVRKVIFNSLLNVGIYSQLPFCSSIQ